LAAADSVAASAASLGLLSILFSLVLVVAEAWRNASVAVPELFFTS